MRAARISALAQKRGSQPFPINEVGPLFGSPVNLEKAVHLGASETVGKHDPALNMALGFGNQPDNLRSIELVIVRRNARRMAD